MRYLRSNYVGTAVLGEIDPMESLYQRESPALTCMAFAEEVSEVDHRKVVGAGTVSYRIDSDCDRLMPSSIRKLTIKPSLTRGPAMQIQAPGCCPLRVSRVNK